MRELLAAGGLFSFGTSDEGQITKFLAPRTRGLLEAGGLGTRTLVRKVTSGFMLAQFP